MEDPSAENPAYESREYAVEEAFIREEPFYLPIADEVEIFRAAYSEQLPVLLKGPTGCGKTRFLEYMAYHLQRPLTIIKSASDAPSDDRQGLPLVTVACHEDLAASDLVGRYLLDGDTTRWIDGPLTRAVRHGAICYLDEVVEARKDTIVLIHPLADHRRILPMEKRGLILEAHPSFLLVISYNPGYQSPLKDLKQSTRQRFVSIEFEYPPRAQEEKIIQHESGVSPEMAADLAKLSEKIRNLRHRGLEEGASTRLLIYAGKLIMRGLSPKQACRVAIINTLTDDREVQQGMGEVVSSIFP